MHQEINSPDTSKVYACVFRPVKSPVRTLYKHISLQLMAKFINLRYERKRSSRRTGLTGLMFAPSVLLFS